MIKTKKDIKQRIKSETDWINAHTFDEAICAIGFVKGLKWVLNENKGEKP